MIFGKKSVSKLSLKTIKVLRGRTSQTLRRNTWYRFSRDYRFNYHGRISEIEESDESPRQRIRLAVELAKLESFLLPESRYYYRRKGNKRRYTRMRALDGEMHDNLLEKDCREVFSTNDLFENLWNDTWQPKSRYLIRSEQGDVRFFESNTIAMLGRMYTASMKRKPVHFVNYIDFSRIDIDKLRKNVEESNLSLGEFQQQYGYRRKKTLDPVQQRCGYLCSINCRSEIRDKERNEKKKQSKKAHKQRDLVQTVLRGCI